MKHTPRGEVIRRRLAADPVVMLIIRRPRRAGVPALDALREVLRWLARLRAPAQLPPLVRRYATGWHEHYVRAERQRRLRRRPGRLPGVRVRWVVPSPLDRDARDVLLPVLAPPRRPIERVRRQVAMARARALLTREVIEDHDSLAR